MPPYALIAEETLPIAPPAPLFASAASAYIPPMNDDDPPARDRYLGTWAVCAVALALWFAAIWFIFGDMI